MSKDKTKDIQKEKEELTDELLKKAQENLDEQKEGKLKEKPKDEVELLKGEIDLLKEQLLRNQAELQNFKRRSTDERIQDRKYASQGVMISLVEVIDNFSKALNFKTDNKELSNFLYGFKMFLDQFNNILTQEGVTKIDSLGKQFDPKIHQAVEKVLDKKKKQDEIVEVMQEGYMFKDRVLRPAVVKINDLNKKEEE